MLRIGYRDRDRRAILSWDAGDVEQQWLAMVRELLADNCDDSQDEGPRALSAPWWAFSGLRIQLLEIFTGFDLELGADLAIDEQAQRLLARATGNTQRFSNAALAPTESATEVIGKLAAAGFTRTLTVEQLRNVQKISALEAAATFSVPGAGKTTEALAYFSLRAAAGDRLLVVAPKNAFAAWDEQLSECMPACGDAFVRLRGGQDRIERLLEGDPRFMLITYQQLPRVKDMIGQHLADHRTFVFLDESHRIKSGIGKLTPQAVLSFAHLPVGKLLMSGTPMPQAVEDLIPQFAFAYPEIAATPDTVVQLMRSVYVRTTKKELGLLPPEQYIKRVQLAPLQRELYKLMKHEVARQATAALSDRSRQVFRQLGRSVARLLQFVSNPALLSAELAFAHSDLLAAVLSEGDGPKINYVLRRARELTQGGEKILIWSSFVKNVEYLAERLGDLGAVFIHGGVDAGDEDDDETREGKIRLFHDDPNVQVLVANPAAASEGISLHRVCHYAIYLDRTFNAAHYLQSVDRIHRLGLAKNQKTAVEIVECVGTVDQTVATRLDFKIDAMGRALEDPSLRPDPIPLDPTNIEDADEYVTGLSEDDVAALLRDLSKE